MAEEGGIENREGGGGGGNGQWRGGKSRWKGKWVGRKGREEGKDGKEGVVWEERRDGTAGYKKGKLEINFSFLFSSPLGVKEEGKEGIR